MSVFTYDGPGSTPIDQYASARARLVELYGDEAARVVVDLQGELSLRLETALQLALAGSPEFRVAAERHLLALRARAAEQRAEADRRRIASERANHRGNLEQNVVASLALLDQHDTRARLLLDQVRATTQGGPDAIAAALEQGKSGLDAERAALSAKLDEAIAARDAFDAAATEAQA